MIGYRLAAMTVPDDRAEPRVLYLVPVDKDGRKLGPAVIGTVVRTRAEAMAGGQVFKTLPALGAFVAPPKRPEPVDLPVEPAA